MPGLFTEYLHRTYIPQQQAARAQRGVPLSAPQVEASAAQYFARPAVSQARSNILGGRMRLARRGLKSRAGEFDKRLALARRGNELRTRLDESRLDRYGDQLKRSKRMFPVNVGLGFGNVGLGYLSGQQEATRLDELAALRKRQHEEIMAKIG